MDSSLKIRIALLLVAVSISALGVFLAAHGIVIAPLDETGGGPH